MSIPLAELLAWTVPVFLLNTPLHQRLVIAGHLTREEVLLVPSFLMLKYIIFRTERRMGRICISIMVGGVIEPLEGLATIWKFLRGLVVDKKSRTNSWIH